MLPNDITLSPLNFNDLSAFRSGFPEKEFTRLRRHDPVYWNEDTAVDPSLAGYWLVTKHADIIELEKASNLIHSRNGLTLAQAPSPSSGAPWSMIRDALFNLDAPRHTDIRKLVAPQFTRKAVEKLREKIQIVANKMLDSLAQNEPFDFVDQVALPYPMCIVVTEILGVSLEDHAQIAYWNDIISTAGNSRFARMTEGKVITEFYEYGKKLFQRAQQVESHDVLSILAHSRMPDGRLVDENVFLPILWTLLTGAFESTTGAISGGLQALLSFEDEYMRLLGNPALVPTAVDEILRWETPLIYVKKTAMKDFLLRGKQIKGGQTILLCYASGNRDEEVFAAADMFRIDRDPNPHLSFGAGPHFCLGAHLVKLELMLLFQEMVRRRMKFRLEGEIVRRGSNFENRIKRLPVSFTSISD